MSAEAKFGAADVSKSTEERLSGSGEVERRGTLRVAGEVGSSRVVKVQNRAATSASFVPDIVLQHITAVGRGEPYETKLPECLAMLADISGFTKLSDALCAHMEQGA